MQRLDVGLGERSYPIYIANHALSQARLAQHIVGSEVVVITNTCIAPLYLQPLLADLEAYQTHHIILQDGEQHKSFASMQIIYNYLLENKISRAATLIALGGGVIGDITGFAAATYQRGVSFIQIPTTLLAQVDSSVGGKTGINHPLGKNMIGAFYQPKAVFISLSYLKTLPAREYASGIAEIIKYGLLGDRALYDYLQSHSTALVDKTVETLSYVVTRSCENKAAIVAQDERESGKRALLNLGHSFGHALETLQQYKGLRHGEAVAVGMLMAVDLSHRLGYLSPQELVMLRSLLESVNLPTSIDDSFTVDAFRQAMSLDKKNIAGKLRLILLRNLGDAFIEEQVDEQVLLQTLTSFLSE